MNLIVKKVSTSCCAFLLCFGILLAVILIPVSLNKIEADEVGVAYDHLTETLSLNDGKVYREGRYMLTPASEFIVYKRTIQTLDYEQDPIRCLSSEGMVMELRITAQYQIDLEHVMDVLTEHGLESEWRPFLDSVARDTMIDVCGRYTADDYFHKRAAIEKDLYNTTRHQFIVSSTYANITLVNLRNVQHPPKFVKINQDKQSTEQEKDRLIREREDLITQETTVLRKAEEDAKIKLINANATAQAEIEKARSLVDAILGKAQAKGPAIIQQANDLAPAENKKWEDRGRAFLNIWSNMGNITVDEFIDTYLRYRVLTSQGDKEIISLPLEQSQASLLNLLVAKL